MGRRRLLEAALGTGAVFALGGCGSAVGANPNEWSDALYVGSTFPRWQWAPTSAEDIIYAVKRAEVEGHRIRMTGSGHSFSDVAINNDWLLSPLRLTAMLPIETASLRSGSNPETLV
jgi:FAD/FMN-containing dehydrogenase